MGLVLIILFDSNRKNVLYSLDIPPTYIFTSEISWLSVTADFVPDVQTVNNYFYSIIPERFFKSLWRILLVVIWDAGLFSVNTSHNCTNGIMTVRSKSNKMDEYAPEY